MRFSGGVEIFSGGVEIFSEGLRLYPGGVAIFFGEGGVKNSGSVKTFSRRVEQILGGRGLRFSHKGLGFFGKGLRFS